MQKEGTNDENAFFVEEYACVEEKPERVRLVSLVLRHASRIR
jgi:hypothetical protein